VVKREPLLISSRQLKFEEVVDPAIHNSNTSKFKGQRLEVPITEDRVASDDLALTAVRKFIDDHGRVPTANLWAAARLSPSEKTIRRRFGSFRAAARLASGF
jgi:hypothetical protein